MQYSRLLASILVVAFALPTYGQVAAVKEFQLLPEREQRRIVQAAYESVSVTLAATQAESKGVPAAKQLASCLRDRDGTWALNAVREYIAEHGSMSTTLGGAIAQAFQWKCGVLTFSGQQAK